MILNFLFFFIGSATGWAAWHLYYLRIIPNLVKKIGYAQRGKKPRKPRTPKVAVDKGVVRSITPGPHEAA